MNRILAATTISILSITSPAFADKKLKIFILAGQSNTVGHANQHTLATLYRSGDTRDERLAKLVFKSDSGLSREALHERGGYPKSILFTRLRAWRQKNSNNPEKNERAVLCFMFFLRELIREELIRGSRELIRGAQSLSGKP